MYMWAHGALLTDGGGRYQMGRLPAGVRVWFQVSKDGYVQQCAAGPLALQGDMAMDLALVSKANVTAAIAPSSPAFRSVSGAIVEMTSHGQATCRRRFCRFRGGYGLSHCRHLH